MSQLDELAQGTYVKPIKLNWEGELVQACWVQGDFLSANRAWITTNGVRGYLVGHSSIMDNWSPTIAVVGNVRAYWIFAKDSRFCWQPDPKNIATLWNKDLKANDANPGDLEQFYFEIADANASLVRIKNRLKDYTQFVGDRFQFGADQGSAALFTVTFL